MSWWRNIGAWVMKVDLINLLKWKDTWECHNLGFAWDTQMAKWVGEGKDWIQEMVKNPLRKDEMLNAILENDKAANITLGEGDLRDS